MDYSQRSSLVWDTGLGFCGFFTVLAGIQAVANVFSPQPVIWPGIVFGLFLALFWGLWRAKGKYLAHRAAEGQS